MEAASKSPLQLGKYNLIAEIGRGGMGIVYLARMVGPAGFQKLAVVKELKPELCEDAKFANMFLDEARLSARLNHRNIVQTNEVGEDGGRFYLAMEYLDGRTLQSACSRLKGEKALSPAMLVRIACEALAGLHYAHELADYDGRPLGIVHRDVSAHNIFLTYDGQVKVLDFGVAKASANTQLTEVGMLKGRVVCMSPEHVDNDRIDRRADIFSMGVLLRETLTGRRLWDGLGEMDVVRELLAKRIPPFPVDVDVPVELRRIVEKAMAVEREDRYVTADDMRRALEAWVTAVDPSSSLHRLGDVLSTEFADQRARVRATIESRSRAEIASMSELPLLPSSTSSPDTSGVSKLSVASGGALSRASAPRSGTVTGTVVSGTVAPPASGLPPARTSSSAIVFGGIALVAVAVAATVVLMRPREAPADPAKAAAVTPAAPPAATSVAAPTYAPGADVVDLTIEATPGNASVFVDGALVENPWHARYPRNGNHEIRVTAAGYSPKIQTVTLTSSTKLDLSLERTAPVGMANVPQTRVVPVTAPKSPDPKPTAVTSEAPSTAAPAATDLAVGGGRAPKRNIDAKNPYQQ